MSKNSDATENPSNGESSRAVSTTKLVVALVVMLIPAAVPLYFAFDAEGTAFVLLVALSGGIAVINVLLVFGIWNWLNTQGSDSDTTS